MIESQKLLEELQHIKDASHKALDNPYLNEQDHDDVINHLNNINLIADTLIHEIYGVKKIS